jgi:hypothetical protein
MLFCAKDKGWRELLKDIEVAGSLQGFYPIAMVAMDRRAVT